MSFQAVTWAIGQKAGGPSAKATLWAIANYANESWCAWPSQKTICAESEQSPDAVQKRLPELEERGIIRRLPLRFAGRKTVDFIILAPSPFFDATPDMIEPLLPRGCTIDPKFIAENVAVPSGSDENATPALPQTLPQVAADVAALVRQQEPSMEPRNQDERENARAREEEKDRLPVKAFLKRWPSAAIDSRAAIEREWEALPSDVLQAALDGIQPFLDELKAHKRSHVPAGATYLQERKWTDLPSRDAPKAPASIVFRAWSREWWAALLARIERGDSTRVMVLQASERGSSEWSERTVRMPPAEQIAALRNYPSDGDVMRAWRPWFDRHGVKLPQWRERVWVFLPSDAPPRSGSDPPDLMTADDYASMAGK